METDLFYWIPAEDGGVQARKDGSIDVHPDDARRLGFQLNHPMNVVNINGRMMSSYRPLTIEIGMYQIDPRKYAEPCSVCGESHEELVIAFLDWYRVYRDTNLLRRSEEREKRWQAEGYDRNVAHRLSQLGISGEELLALAEARAVQASDQPATISRNTATPVDMLGKRITPDNVWEDSPVNRKKLPTTIQLTADDMTMSEMAHEQPRPDAQPSPSDNPSARSKRSRSPKLPEKESEPE